MLTLIALPSCLSLSLLFCSSAPVGSGPTPALTSLSILSSDYVKDMEFALEQVGKECAELLRSKDIDWKAVSKQFRKEAKKVESDDEQWLLLLRLIARLEDGHARVELTEKTKGLEWPLKREKDQTGPGMFWCEVDGDIYIKNSFRSAFEVGVRPGMQVMKVDGMKVDKWIEQELAVLRDTQSFSTDHQARYSLYHWGLGGDVGSRIKLELKGERKTKKATVTRIKASVVPSGPAFFPEGLEGLGRQSYGRLPSGMGYIHLRDAKPELPEQMDEMLGALGHVPGLVLDFRANGGGSCDGDKLLGLFVPKGKELPRASAYPIPSWGENPYGGPLVVIVDAGVRSTGETASGMFKEDGRGYMIGETPTAGMSSSKTTIELPSGRFNLYVSVHSNKSRFQGGRGIEGLGVAPHEVVYYDPAELAEGIDTHIRRAEELLVDFPQKKVPYDPADFDWSAPK